MSDERSGAEEDPQLLVRRCGWCGVVFGLAVLLTVLNIFPPAEVRYEVDSEVVVPAARLDQLKALISQPQAELDAVRLSALKVLDEGESASRDELVLVELTSVWPHRCTSERHVAWLGEVTKLSRQFASDSRLARESRFARWQLQAATHYADRYEHLVEAETADKRVFELKAAKDSTSSGVPATLAAYGSPVVESEAADTEAPGNVREHLQQLISDAKSSLAHASVAWDEEAALAAASMKLTETPTIEVQHPTMPTLFAISILVIGVACTAIGSWTQHKMYQGRTFEPSFVAEKLALQGLPLAGKVHVAEPRDETWLDATSRTTAWSLRGIAKNLLVASEWIVAVWFVLIVMRFCLDPIWRQVAFENPLVAFARVLVGFP